jgi:hypothetical protein
MSLSPIAHLTSIIALATAGGDLHLHTLVASFHSPCKFAKRKQ